jgi:two-component system cell cycle sensor histidine kinase/response regulator CckA
MVIAATTDTPAVLLLDQEGRILSANAAAASAIGRQIEALIGTLFVESLRFELNSSDPEMLAIQWEALSAAARARAQSVRPIDGTRSYHLRLDPIDIGGAEWTATLVALPEISSGTPFPAPAAAAHPLQDSLLLIANRASLGFFDLRLDSGELVTSNGWKRVLGYAEHELPDTLASWRSLVHSDDTAASPDYAPRRQPAGTRPFSVEYRMRHRAGHYLWISCTGVRVFGPEGALQRVCGVLLDVTERKELEEISILNDERLQRLSTQGGLAAFDLDFTNGQHWFSAAWHRLLGTRSAAEDSALPAPTPLVNALPPEIRDAGVDAFLLGTPGEGEESRRVISLRNAAGDPLPVLLCLQREFGRRDQLSRVIGYAIPVAGLATDPAATPPQLLSAALDALAEAVIITDSHGLVVSCNAKASALLAVPAPDAAGRPLADVFPLVHRANGRPANEAVELALNQPHPGRLDDTHSLAPSSPDAAPRPIVWTALDCRGADGVLTGFIVVFRDPAEMSLTPEELVRANRFESLGILAGGISHDFNNLLTTILGGISTAKDSREFNQLDSAEQACLAAKQLTRQLLAFAKGAGAQATRQVVSPADLLQNAVRIAAAGSPVVVRVETPSDLFPVEIDKGQILQVIQNLVINAIQAMPVPADGRVTLSAANITLADKEFDDLPSGGYLRIDVQDNGAGIAPEILPRIFDPFFTTKKSGTGLGLATVDSIVRRHGGRIGVQSSPGVGTLFSVLLPVASRPVQEETRRAPALRFGTGRILFMDDDPKICELTGAMIASLDYTHDIARNGEEAIQLYRRYLAVQRPYDAVLLDLTIIGGMGGEECFKRLRELDPDVHAIVSSGYDDDEMVQRYLDMGFVGYITKPYRVGDLGRVLKSVLAR